MSTKPPLLGEETSGETEKSSLVPKRKVRHYRGSRGSSLKRFSSKGPWGGLIRMGRWGGGNYHRIDQELGQKKNSKTKKKKGGGDRIPPVRSCHGHKRSSCGFTFPTPGTTKTDPLGQQFTEGGDRKSQAKKTTVIAPNEDPRG